jgi:outer membrane PBP1 activator LpoA protein
MQLRYHRIAIIIAIPFIFSACKPSEPPPDIIKTQRDVLNKSKAVEGQLEQHADEQKKALENAEK